MKKTFMPLVALLSFLVISPAMAAPKTKLSFNSHVTLVAGNISMGQQIIEDGILYVNGAISTGTVTAPITGATIDGELWTELSGIGNLETGQGSFQGKFRIANGVGNFEGTVTGIVTTTSQYTARVSGSFVGFGTDGYAKDKIKGSFEGYVEYGSLQVELDMTGLLTSKDA